MKKILVTTDFSSHSKAAMRFAVQLSIQSRMQLCFFHSFQALVPSTVFRDRIEQEINKQTDEYMQKLVKFVDGIYQSMKIKRQEFQYVVAEHPSPVQAILEYTKKNDIDYICISTRGAGLLPKLIGTVADRILLDADIPVLAIPFTYRRKPLAKLVYASDLENLDQEIAVVDAFAKALELRFDLLHFYYPAELRLEEDALKRMWRSKHKRLDLVHFQQADIDKGFAVQLNDLFHKIKPSVAVFFTHRRRTWLDKLFYASRSKQFSHATNVPMLVYKKGSPL